MVITSLDNERIKKYHKLKKKKYRDEYGEYIVEGMHLVMEAFKKGMIIELILEEDEIIPFPGPYVYIGHDIVSKVSTMECPSTIMALCKKIERDELIGDRILILDQIQDPGNLGTIIRSAAAFNIDTVVLSENTVDLYNPKVLRATQGMFFNVNIIHRKTDEIITILRNLDIPVYGTRVEYGEDVSALGKRDKKKFAVVVGNEGNGVRSEVNEMCDRYLYIKMNEAVESLNVGVAASILLYELGK